MDIIKSDVLIIGGGIAGCFAAIKASEMGQSVALLDKATVRRGGSVGPGMDHLYMGVHPESMSLDDAKKHAIKERKNLVNPNLMLAIDVHAMERNMDLQKYGVKVLEDDGSLSALISHKRSYYFISYRGVDTKVKLAEAVRKTKTRVFDRTMGVELLTHNGRVIGTIALNTRTGDLTAFLAKATIIATGEAGRQYIEADGPFMTYHPVSNSGDAGAMAYRAGAKLANMEFTYIDHVMLRTGGGVAGMKPFEETGKLLNCYGDLVVKTEEDLSIRPLLMAKEIAEGRGPLYWDFSELSEDVMKQYDREMSHEWPITKEWFKQRNLNLRKDQIPAQLTPVAIIGGPLVDETCSTSVPGLYVAGACDAFFIGLTNAMVTGYIAAEEASVYSTSVDVPQISGEYLESLEKNILAPLNRNNGTDPKELEIALRNTLTDYVGFFKTEGLMQKGLEKVLEIKGQFYENMTALNAHELMRCCEVKNIFDTIEMHIRTSLYRKETRIRRVGRYIHVRSDYTESDPKMDYTLVIIQRDAENNIVIETSEVPELKEV